MIKDFDLVISCSGGGTSGIGSLEIIKVIDEKLTIRGFPPGTYS